MEQDHKLTIEQYSELERILLEEIRQLESTGVYVNVGTTDQPQYVYNKNHDTQRLSIAIRTFTEVKKGKSDALLANPVVQAIILKHDRDMEAAKSAMEEANVSLTSSD